MKLRDALNVLGINKGNITREEAKKAYHRACLNYHPDRNKAGHEIMKMVIQAWEALKERGFPLMQEDDGGEFYDYGAEINSVLNRIVGLEGIEIEICGSWVWVGNTRYEHRSVFCPPRQKGTDDEEIRFRWSRDKKMWYFHPKNNGCRRWGKGTYSIEQIKIKYGAVRIKGKTTFALNANA